MNILVKFPIRARVSNFWRTLKAYRDGESGKHQVQYVITCDSDDPGMNQYPVRKKLDEMDRLGYRYGTHKTKIEACNADMDLADPAWEVLILVSDDMVPTAVGWDDRIATDMQEHYPDTDGCLWYHDGHVAAICTLSIIGRKYYDSLGYIYHPSYKSLWSDNEHTQVALEAGKMWRSEDVIIEHRHPLYGHGEKDTLLQRNEGYYGADQMNFVKRQQEGFPK